jgi:hypothetical protein
MLQVEGEGSLMHRAGEADILKLPAGVVDSVQRRVGEEGSLGTAAAAHRLQQAVPFGDDDDRPCGYCDSRGSLSGCPFQAPISACHFRSSQSGMWNLLCLVSAVPTDWAMASYGVVAAPWAEAAAAIWTALYFCHGVPYS